MANNNPNPNRGTGGKFTSAKEPNGKPATGNNGADFVDPEAAATAAGAPDEPRHRRGRRKGGNARGATATPRTAAAPKGASLDLSAAAGLLSGFHAIIALRRNEPHWMLSEADSKRYGQALANALRHMPIHAAQKTIDFGVLAFMIFEIETPRIVRSAQLARMSPHQRQAMQRGPAKIFEFASPPTSATPQSNGASSPTTATGSTQQDTPPIADPPQDGIGGDGGSLQ